MTQGQAQVFDLGYQAYTGPREGRDRSRRALFENGVRTLLGIGRGGRAKILPILLLVATITPALIFVVVLALAGVEDELPTAGEYYGIVGLILVLFGAVMSPELLIADRRSNVLQLYLVRPVTATDYVVARFLAFFVVVLALVYSGQVILLAGYLLTVDGPGGWLKDNWLDIPRFLGASVLFALFVTAIPMAAAAVISRRAYVAVFVIAAFLATSLTADGLAGSENCEAVEIRDESGLLVSRDAEVCESVVGGAAPYISLLNLFQAPQSLNDMIFDERPESPSGKAVAELNNVFPIGAYAVFTVLPCLFLWQRYRRLAL